MTRSDYEALAKIIAGLADAALRAKLAKSIGNLCASTNVHFNWPRWYAACHCNE